MATRHKSTIKRARQALKRQARNRAVQSSVKSVLKRVLSAVEEKKADEAKAALHDATSAAWKAVSKGVLKPNTAARRISRLAAKVNALSGPAKK